MTFDKDATVNVNELLNQFKSHYRSGSFRDEDTMINTYAITFIDVENILKDMTSRSLKQKVISGLEHCIDADYEHRDCDSCPYYEVSSCIATLQRDSLKVLK